ncbi:MAG: hypothetical protein ACI4N3_03530 [Alphaproteobacteria bacterium]
MKINLNNKILLLGLTVASVLPNHANADLFKCVACSNKPANSSYTSSGNGSNNCSWSCNSGYTKKGNTCCANPPANATLNANNCGWSCNGGYKLYNGNCIDENTVICGNNQFRVGNDASAVCCNKKIIFTMSKYSRTCSNCSNALETITKNSEDGFSALFTHPTMYITSWDFKWTYNNQKYKASVVSNTNRDSVTGYVCNDKILYKSYSDNKYKEIKGTKDK